MRTPKPVTNQEIEQELGISILSNEHGEVWYADLIHGGHWKSTYNTLRKLTVEKLAMKGVVRS